MLPKNKKIKKEGKLQAIFFGALLVFFILGICGFLIVSNFRMNQKRSEMQNTISSLQKEIQDLETQNQKLESGISQTQSASYWEGKAREQGYQKPGEQAVVVVPPKENTATSTGQAKSFWQKILDKIGL